MAFTIKQARDFFKNRIGAANNAVKGLVPFTSQFNQNARQIGAIASNVAKPIAQTIGRGLEAQGRIQAYNNPFIGKRGLQRANLPVPTTRDVGTMIKGGLTSYGAVAAPAFAAASGLFNTGLAATSNLFQRKPITQGLDTSFGQGFAGGALAGPVVRATNPFLARAIGPVAGRLTGRIAGAGGNVLQGLGLNIASGTKPTLESIGIDVATGLVGGKGQFGRPVGKSFTLNKDIRLRLEEAEQILRNPDKFIDETRNFANPVAREKAVKRAVEDALQFINETGAQFLPEKQLEKANTPQKIIKYLIDLSSQNRLGNTPLVGGLVDSAQATKGLVGLDSKPNTKIQSTVPSQLELPNQTGIPTDIGAIQSRSSFGDIVSPETKSYLDQLKKSRSQAAGGPASGALTKGKNLLSDIKAKIVDSAAPIEDALDLVEKKYKFKVLPTQDVRYQIDRVLRSKTLAGKFAEDNGLVDVIKKAPDLEALDQYMIAKQAKRVQSLGKETGRDLDRDSQLVSELAGIYEPLAQQVNEYSRKLLQYSVDTGLIDDGLAKQLVKKYPEYVPLNRVFSELEKASLPRLGMKQVASLSKQTVVQKLEGSEREIASPIESMLIKTQDAFNQGERNIAAKQLASYRSLPGFKDLIKELPAGGSAPHTISFIDRGVKKTFATTREFEAAAKSLNQEQMGLLGKIFSVPTRVLQLGATGLNLPFVITNVVKDQITGFINSSNAAKTSLLNPLNFGKALFSAVKHDDLYDQVVRAGAGGTSFDIARQAPNLSVKRIRAGRSLPTKALYTVTHPLELLRAVEDIVGRGEELSRIQQFSGTKQALQKSRTAQDATILAADAARKNTANFARKGEWGRVVNWVIPFFNAGIQGARQLVRSFQNNPAATSAKVATTLFMPVAAATAWNLNDPQRRSVYEDIPDYEKENNIIIIPDNPVQDAKGRWNVIKIPVPPGLSNLTSLVRRPLEQASGLDPVRFGEIATNLITASTSIDLSNPNKLASSFTPQAAKPIIEDVTNTNLFTGNKIVPEFMKNLPPEAQVRPDTGKIPRAIGKVLGVSPLRVENAARTIGGGLGAQLIGQDSVAGNLERRFSKAASGKLVDRVYDEAAKIEGIEKQIRDLAKSGDKESARRVIEKNKDILLKADEVKEFKNELSELFADRRKVQASTQLTPEQKTKLLSAIQQRINKVSQAYSVYQGGAK